MTENLPIVRVEHLQELTPWLNALNESLSADGLTHEKRKELMRATVLAECVQCGIHVPGEDLFALSQPDENTSGKPKICRLRLGDCARNGCKSLYYRVTFISGPRIDWLAALQKTENPPQKPSDESAGGTWEAVKSALPVKARISWRFWAVVAVITLVLVARQLYYCGRIPLIREPENFRVDTAPSSEPAK